MNSGKKFVKIIPCIILTMQMSFTMNLNAQDYLISFAGSGESSTVATVKVENLTQWKSVEMNGSDILHLKSVVTDIEQVLDKIPGRVSFYPNPMKDYTRMQFDLPVSGETTVALYDLSGRSVAQTRDLLYQGSHTYVIDGLEEGFYFVRINCSQYSTSGRLISSGSQNRNARIVYESSGDRDTKVNSEFIEPDAKGTYAETVMQYTTGDRLKFTGISGIYGTVLTDIPTSGKTLTFSFVECTDGDNNNYPVVKIGDQLWMAENLRTTKYRDKMSIPNVTDQTAWSNLKTPGYCWYENEASANKDIYGALYNWYTVETGKLCPEGYHVPSDAEWTTLTSLLGGLSASGKKLKETGGTHWYSPWYEPTTATNETGFTALPGGMRVNTGTFDYLTYGGAWWSSDQQDATTAWGRIITYENSSAMTRGWDYKPSGSSVRCLAD